MGIITKPHGLKGEVKMKLLGCSPEFLEEFEEINIEDKDLTLKVEYIRGSDKIPIFKFDKINDRETADMMVGAELWVHESEMPDLEQDEFYESDFLYSQVQTEEGHVLGRIEEIIETGESDVLVIRDSSGNEILIPAILDVIKEVKKKESIIVVKTLEEAF